MVLSLAGGGNVQPSTPAFTDGVNFEHDTRVIEFIETCTDLSQLPTDPTAALMMADQMESQVARLEIAVAARARMYQAATRAAELSAKDQRNYHAYRGAKASYDASQQALIYQREQGMQKVRSQLDSLKAGILKAMEGA